MCHLTLIIRQAISMSNYKLRTTDRQTCDTLTTNSEQTTTNNKVVLSTSTSTTSSIATEPCVCISPEALEAIREAYVACVGFMTASIAHEIEAAIKDGMFPEVVIDAIQQTGNAPRPSPYYLRTILRRCRRDGILNADQLAADKEKHEQRSTPPWWKSNPALRYEQRPINNDESLFTDLSAYLERRKSDEKPEASSL